MTMFYEQHTHLPMGIMHDALMYRNRPELEYRIHDIDPPRTTFLTGVAGGTHPERVITKDICIMACSA